MNWNKFKSQNIIQIMKKLFLILTVLFFSASLLQAQSKKNAKNGKKREKIAAMRTAFITEKLELTEAEAEKFWPITNQYHVKRKAVNNSYKQDKSLESMTDEEAEALINDHIAKEQQLLDLKKDYIRQLKSVLPAKKIVKLKRVNRQFKKEILKRSGKRKEKRKMKMK